MTPLTRVGAREASEFLGLPLRLRRPKSPVDGFRVRGMSERDIAATRLACSWLLAYPDGPLLEERLDGLAAAVAGQPQNRCVHPRGVDSHTWTAPSSVTCSGTTWRSST